MNIRGQKVDSDGNTLFLEIHKPLGNTFSISDKLKSYIDQGYLLKVRLPYHTVILTKDTPFLRKEIVKSKFSGAPDWARYWYKTTAGEQKELF